MNTNDKLLRIDDVREKTTLAKSTIWLKMAQGQFPKPFKLSPAINVWRESEINEWVESQFKKSKLESTSKE